MPDQDQNIEKKREGFEEKPDVESPEEHESVEEQVEGAQEKKDLEQVSSVDQDQEKKQEALSEIQKSGGAKANDDDDQEKKQIDIDAKEISSIKDAEQQVEKLVQLAEQKDPYTAVKVAKHIDENYVLDQVHDRLMEEDTKRALFEKGLLKEL